MPLKALLCALAAVATLAAHPAAGRDAGDPIRLAWVEGDVAGMTSILSPDGASTIGFIDYHQRRRAFVPRSSTRVLLRAYGAAVRLVEEEP